MLCFSPAMKQQSNSVFQGLLNQTMPSKSSFIFMAHLVSLSLFFLMICSASAQGPPSPGYNPSSKVNSLAFDQGYRNLWGSKHQSLDQGELTIWLDSNSGLTSSPLMSLTPFCSLGIKMSRLAGFLTSPLIQ